MQEYQCQQCGLTWFWLINGPCARCGGELKPIREAGPSIGEEKPLPWEERAG